MNQTSRQNAKNSIEKDFFKLMNNAVSDTTVEIIYTIANLYQFLMN